MMDTNQSGGSREHILGLIRAGLDKGRLPMPFPEAEAEPADAIYSKSQSLSYEEQFASEFIKLGGKFVYCETLAELATQIDLLHDQRGWNRLLCSDPGLLQYLHEERLGYVQDAGQAVENAEACITLCERLVARTGSVLLTSRQRMGRTASVYYPVHIVVAFADQLDADIDQALSAALPPELPLPSMINLNTGPSRTADIEKTLVVGVHGPREVFCFLVASRNIVR